MGSRKMNAFFKQMLAAKRRGDESFQYNGKKYVRKMTRPKSGSALKPVPYYSAGKSKSRKRKGTKRKKTRKKSRA